MPKVNSEFEMTGEAALRAMTLLVLMSEKESPFASALAPS